MIPNPWILLAFVLALLGAWEGGTYTGKRAGRAEIQQAWDKEKAAQYADFARRQEEARKKEQELQANADQLRREKDAEIRNINARTIALANSLRDRNERPAKGSELSQSADARSSATGCTGKGLYRSDGEFLAREAAAGRQCQALLRECRSAYEKVVNQ